jgi:DNA-binding transcriptional LysR family regulator
MDRFENARVFVTVVEAGGFTRAAERLGLSRAAASKHVLQLEERLRARLLNRTTRRVSVTAAGRAFYEQCRRILAEFDEAERSVGELHNTPSGSCASWRRPMSAWQRLDRPSPISSALTRG